MVMLVILIVQIIKSLLKDIRLFIFQGQFSFNIVKNHACEKEVKRN